MYSEDKQLAIPNCYWWQSALPSACFSLVFVGLAYNVLYCWLRKGHLNGLNTFAKYWPWQMCHNNWSYAEMCINSISFSFVLVEASYLHPILISGCLCYVLTMHQPIYVGIFSYKKPYVIWGLHCSWISKPVAVSSLTVLSPSFTGSLDILYVL